VGFCTFNSFCADYCFVCGGLGGFLLKLFCCSGGILWCFG